jgi:hypothetical protein
VLTKLKWTFRIAAFLTVAGFLHYTLPQHDIVRITNTYNRLTAVSGSNGWAYASPDSGTTSTTGARDIRFVEAVYDDESVMVFRNEDTGWIWPPYFKYDSSNLQAQAANLKSVKTAPIWVSVTHYGWRLPMLSIYPNAVSVREVAGPGVRIIPYVNIIVLLLLAIGAFMVRRMWLQFIERTVEPVMADVQETFDGVGDQANAVTAQAGGLASKAVGWAKGLLIRKT